MILPDRTLQRDTKIVDILSEAFADNLSVNYVLKQDRHQPRRVRRLMQYALATCHDFGDVWLSEDEQACALTMLPDTKRTTFMSVQRDAKLAFSATGIRNVYRTLQRVSKHTIPTNLSVIYGLWALPEMHRDKGSVASYFKRLSTIISHSCGQST